MSSEGGELLHGGVLPHDDLIERVTVSAYKLIVGLREDQIANLRASVDAVQRRQVDSVPEADALVSRATSSSQKASVKRAPVNSFDSRLVI